MLIRGDRARQALLLAAAWVATVGSGCSIVDRRPTVPIDSAAGLYDSAKIEYKLDAGQLNLPLAVTRVEGQLVSYDQVPSNPRRDKSIGTLKIEYPHPDGRPGVARARLEISSTAPGASAAAATAGGTNSSWSKVANTLSPKRLWTSATSRQPKVDEAWELDIPRSHLDEAVTSLNRSGYFDTRQKGIEGVAVAARVDGKQLNKSWRQVPELNELMLMVRNQGRLVSYAREADSPASPNPPSSLAIYERYRQQDQLASAAVQTPSWQQAASPSGDPAAVPSGAPAVVPYFAQAAPGSGAVPQPDSLPWRHGSRPAPALPQPQPPASYPSTGFDAAPSAASPNLAQQPQWQGTPY